MRNGCQWGGQWSHRERQERTEQTEGLIAFPYPFVLMLGRCLVGGMVGGRTIVLFLWWFSLLLIYCMHKCYMHISWFNSVEITFYLLYYICNLSSLSGLWGDMCIFFFILFSIMICHRILNIVPCVGRPPFLHTPSWSVADSQCCVCFRRTAKWLSSTNTCYLFSFKFFSHVGYCRVLSRVPCAIQ